MLRAYSSYGRENLDSHSHHRCEEICKSDFWSSFPEKSYRGSKRLTKSSQIPIGSTIGNHRLPDPILRGFLDISRLSRPRHRPHMFSRAQIVWGNTFRQLPGRSEQPETRKSAPQSSKSTKIGSRANFFFKVLSHNPGRHCKWFC